MPITPDSLAHADALAAFDAELLSASSATVMLQKRCNAPLKAKVERAAKKDAPPDVRVDLGAGPEITIIYRRVSLKCGETVYLHAENWYRPDRLSDTMNEMLLAGDTPFGEVIEPLRPKRHTVAREFLDQSDAILRHRAVVVSASNQPLAVVIETYTPEVLSALPK